MPNDPLIPPKSRQIEILAFVDVQLLDVTGPFQVFATANDLAVSSGCPAPYGVKMVSADPGPIASSSGLTLVAEPLPPPGHPVDTLIIAGGAGVHSACRDDELVDWIRCRTGYTRRTASVCTGAFLLAAAGLLDGKRATTHWSRCARLAAAYPSVRVEQDPIYINDGTIWTSAGVTAGIDMALALVDADLGRTAATAVAQHLVVFAKRPGGQTQFSAGLALAGSDGSFDRLHEWMKQNLRDNLAVPALAEQAGMSERSFLRRYRQVVGTTPARAVERIRVEAARQALGETSLPLKRIARDCGFGSEETMRRSFLRILAVPRTPIGSAFPFDPHQRFLNLWLIPVGGKLTGYAAVLMFWIQFALVLGAILLGIRRGGVALGMIGGLGVAVLTLGFRERPSEPPIVVMLIILAVVTASATLQVAGGLDWLVQKTERMLRAHPTRVTILAPLCTFFLTVCVGTGHAVYSLLPVIADVALKTRIRPERPMAISSVAAQMGITASPVAAAVTTFLALAAKTSHPVGLFDIIKVTMPAGIAGVLAAAAWSMNRGKELDQDPDFQDRLRDPAFRTALQADVTTLGKVLPKTAPLSVVLFFGGIFTVVMLALFPELLPRWGKVELPMTTVVQIVMLGYGAFILFACDVKAAEVASSSVFRAGMIAVVSIFGIAWMSDTFVTANKVFLVGEIKEMVQFAPWTFAIAMFCVSAFVKSQAATLTIMIPFGIALGLSTPLMLGLMPSSYAYFFFAFYPSDLAAINMDRTGTTHIGRFLLNHSFMIPGLIGVGVSTTVGYFLSLAFF